MSGHSRWSQIKRKKGKTDVQRGKLFSKILREITVAAKNGGGDPKGNMRLKAAMESAQGSEHARRQHQARHPEGDRRAPGEQYEEITYEGYGVGRRGGARPGPHRQQEPHRARDPAHLREERRRHGHVGRGGVDVRPARASSRSTPSKIKEDDLSRRRSTRAPPTSSGSKKFSRSPRRLMKWTRCARRSSGRGCRCSRRPVTYVPQSTVRVEGKEAAAVMRLIEALEELDDVQSVYANYDIPDEVLEAITAACGRGAAVSARHGGGSGLVAHRVRRPRSRGRRGRRGRDAGVIGTRPASRWRRGSTRSIGRCTGSSAAGARAARGRGSLHRVQVPAHRAPDGARPGRDLPGRAPARA